MWTYGDFSIRFADYSDVGALRALWQACFDDSDAYLDIFFSRRFRPDRTLVCLVNGGLIGAAYLFQIKLMEAGKQWNYLYSYAEGVLPGYRRRGVMSALHEAIYRHCEREGASLLLTPSGPETAGYFARMGMKSTVFSKRVRVSPLSEETAALTPISAAEYAALRKERFYNYDYFEWDEGSIAYALEENLLCDGFSYGFTLSGTPCAFVGGMSGTTLRIRELIAPAEHAAESCSLLCRCFGAESALCDLPEAAPLSGERILTGMTYGRRPPVGAYFNLYWD